MDFPNSWATPKVSHTEQDWWVSAFYGFAEVKDPAAVKDHMDALLDGQRVYGSILVASEGANGTICAPHAGFARKRTRHTGPAHWAGRRL